MLLKPINKKTYLQWLKLIKEQVRSSQLKASIAVNTELIQFYWLLGESIVEQVKKHNWGSAVIDQLAIDLKKEFPDMDGFSRTNLYYIKQFYEFYSQGTNTLHVSEKTLKTPVNKEKKKVKKVPQAVGQIQKTSFIPQAVGQIPWGHHRLIIDKIKDYRQALFYLHQTIQNNWSRNVLALQIDTGLHKRQGKALNNFKLTLPKKQSELAIQTLKDPYIFDFLSLNKNASERDIELQLTQQLAKFLLELGQGFAFVGSQYQIKVEKKDYKLDLLFYHTHLRCYIVIELKAGEFEPEHAGKLNFYLSAVDSQIKHKLDNPTIGILLCRTKNNIEVEYSLRDTKKPIGVSGFKFLEKLPKNLQDNLPSVAQLEAEFKKITRASTQAISKKK